MYFESKKAIEEWKKEKYIKKESIVKKLRELEQKASLYKQTMEQYKNIER